MFCISLSYTE